MASERPAHGAASAEDDRVARSFNAALSGRYAIERELGRGGNATVYLARDERHARHVAIKVIHPDLARTLGAERFLREIAIAAELQHPHILALHDSGEAEGLLYYVMPYVRGESLRVRLDRVRQLPVDEAIAIARDIAGALDYAHRHGVIHRDVKPENILLDEGHAMLADFGIARALAGEATGRLSATGTSPGTPTYMSPEQAGGDAVLDGRSDIYALGCVTYEMLAGEPPFTGPTAESIVRQHLSAPAPLVTAIRESVPASVAMAIGRALMKSPADRFKTAAEFGTALLAAEEQHHTPARKRRVGLLAGAAWWALLLWPSPLPQCKPSWERARRGHRHGASSRSSGTFFKRPYHPTASSSPIPCRRTAGCIS